MRFASGPARVFAPGETVYKIGEQNVPAWLVLKGALDAARREGLSNEVPVTTYGPGQLTGEMNQLAGRPSLAIARAGADGCTALPFDSAHLRSLIIGSADVGELTMRSLILRRAALIEEGGSAGPVLIGIPGSAELLGLQNFLTRSSFPNLVLDATVEGEAHALVERLGVIPSELPIMVCPNGTVLKHPSEAEVAACLGITPQLDPQVLYDVAVVGAGPAGLATSVYAASEGLSVLLLDEHAYGGQAGASMRIENYLGFPTGISGQALAGRAFSQALKFGAEIAIPLQVSRLSCSPEGNGDDDIVVTLANGAAVHARTVVIASGARYRRPDVQNLAAFESSAVFYWASPVEAKLCKGEEVALLGGGNSAGQAVVFLAPWVKRLHLVVRRDMSETMSRYLIDRIAALTNVELHVRSELAALEGDAVTGLKAARFRNRGTEAMTRRELRHIFLFIGAEPNTEWLSGCVTTDGKGSSKPDGDLPMRPSRVRLCPWKPACRECSPLVTFAPAQPSASPPP